MQHASLVLFCDECGLANDPAASHCAGCQSLLVHANSMLHTPPVAPITIARPTVLEVTPGPLFVPGNQGTRTRLRRYPACDFRPGSLLAGRYEIKGEIGSGGFSTVYRAVDQEVGYNDRPVAIKRIQLDRLSPRQIIDATETFNREVEMLARFRSMEGIPAYYEHLTDAENWYLISQYIEGQTLEDYLRDAPGGYLAENEVLNLGIALASLMQRLHSNEPPVIFRDLKPSNIMLTPERTFFLIDFGIARTFAPNKTKDTTPLGSPGYATPEQYGRAQTGQRSDIYSLGATLQTLLTGHDPLELRSGEASRNPMPSSPGLRKLLSEMLSSEMSQRPPDMKRVKRRLEYVSHRPVSIFLSGLVFGGALDILWQISFLTPFGNSSEPFMGGAFVPLAILAESFFKKKVHLPTSIPKGFWRFWWAGLFVGLLPWLLLSLILWRPIW
ncbi:MAG TPA: serine/threonine-protein kinase [Ktedonobacteraceae bacterium]|nr:serine/threonine-protein kinase [Ktedonobacteraceae bacterium]